MSDHTIPEYLQPALAQLEKARAAHLENARLMDETITAIERAEQEKNVLAQTDGNDADDWRTAFRAAGGVLSDELNSAALSAWHAGSWYRNMTIWPWC